MRRFAATLLAGLATTTAYAQAPGERGRESRDTQDQARTATAAAGHHNAMHHKGVDREAAIGHALDMAIDGSALWHCAQKAEAKGVGTERKAGNTQAMRDPAGILEQHARDSFRGSERLFQAVMQDEKSQEKAQGRDQDAKGSEHMARHQACEEFYRAARDYSRALETSCSNTRQSGAEAANAANATSSSEACAENGIKVALINHAVKEAVEGVALQQMLRHHGEHDRTTQALESHAQQMLASSRHAIDSIDKSTAGDDQSRSKDRDRKNDQARNDVRSVRRDAARPNYDDERAHTGNKSGEAITVNQLAKLGREVIRSVERLNQDSEQHKNKK